MTDSPDRRAFLKAAAATSALGAVGAARADTQTTSSGIKLGEATPFSFGR